MSHQPPSQSALADVRNLDHVNRVLSSYGISALTPSTHSQLLTDHGADKVARAMELAPSQSGARTFLAKEVAALQPAVHPADIPPTNSRVTPINQARASTQQSQSQPPDEPAARAQASEPHQETSQEEAAPDPDPRNVSGSNKDRHYINEHVYGGKAALCFSADQTQKEIPTVSIEAAPSTGRPRDYDWSRKVSIQLTQGELPVVAAVLFGLIPFCEFSSHGPQKNKGFRIENQDGKVFVQLRMPNTSYACPVAGPDLYRIGCLVARQLQVRNSNLRSVMDVVQMLRLTVVRLSTPLASSQSQASHAR